MDEGGRAGGIVLTHLQALVVTLPPRNIQVGTLGLSVTNLARMQLRRHAVAAPPATSSSGGPFSSF